MTFYTLLMNRELIRHGFSPAIFDNPNGFDGLAPDEALSELIRGMKNFQYIKKAPHTIRCERG